jgi:ribosomal protein S18 acetylase RimI-like enzyme
MIALRLELARPADAEELARISRRAFDSDVQCGASDPGGPPGYDSAEWQAEMIRRSSAYWKIVYDNEIMGGAIIFARPRGRYYLARMFLDPTYHRRGLGRRVMRMLLAEYPEARGWQLETPPWNTRTRPFYEALGFRVVRETTTDLVFRLDLSPHDA